MTGPLAGRVGSFALVTLLPAAAGLVLMPVLARAVSTAEWAAIAVGQSVGAMAGVVGVCGWPLTGPSRVATADRRHRRALYVASLRMRMAALVLLLPVGGAVTWLLAPPSATALALAVFAAMALATVSPRWFLVGEGSSGDILRFEALPLAASSLAAAGLIAAGADPLVYPAGLGLALVGGALAFTITLRRRLPDTPGGPGLRWRDQLRPTVTEVVGGAYSTANVALVSTQLAVGALATYASGWRLYQWGALVVVGVCQSLQGWVGADPTARAARYRTALAIHAVVGAAGCLGLATLGPEVSALLFGDGLRAPREVAVGLGVAFLALSLSSSLGRHVLVPSGRVGAVLASTVLGAVVGVPAIVVAASIDGAGGAAMALAVTEAVVCGYQALLAWPLLRTGAPQPEPSARP